MHKLLTLAAVVAIACVQGASAQEEAASTQPVFHYEQWQDYRVGVGDVLEIQVVDVPDLNQTVTVSSLGEINVHPVGNLSVIELTAAQLEEEIAKTFEERDLLQTPQVLVFVRAYRAKRIYVSGEVGLPGEYIMSQNLTVLDAILLGGGLSPRAARNAFVHRRASEEGSKVIPPTAEVLQNPDLPRPGVEITEIDLSPLAEGKAPVPDLLLEPGDYIIVPVRQLEFFFVLGDVMRPLNYLMPLGKTVMVSQAIAGAGGPTPTAKMSEGLLVRMDEEGNREEIGVDFKAILEGRQKDIQVHPNDIVFIPGSKIKTVREGLIRASPNMISQTAFMTRQIYQLPGRTGGGVTGGADAAASPQLIGGTWVIP